MIENIRKHPPKITQEHRDGAAQLLKKHQENEEKKDRESKKEIKDFSKDISGFVYNQIRGIGKVFHGFGEGKKVLCSFPDCGKHESQMFNKKDGQWYCGEHRWFGDLTEKQKQEERNAYQQNRG